MLDRAKASAWLDAYVHAWKSYDAQEIGALFSENAVYVYHPYREPVRGREQIIAMWLDENNRDAPGTYDAHYEPVLIEGNRAVTNGRSLYFEADGKTLTREFDNVFFLTFDDAGRCAEYREWYMERPK